MYASAWQEIHPIFQSQQRALACRPSAEGVCDVGCGTPQVLLAAGDTFRAAAAEQLAGWAERAGAQLEAAASEKQRPDALLYAAVDKVGAPGASHASPTLGSPRHRGLTTSLAGNRAPPRRCPCPHAGLRTTGAPEPRAALR